MTQRPLSSLSRGDSKATQLGVRMTSGRVSSPLRMTPKQQKVWDMLKDDKVTLAGRTLTGTNLSDFFRGTRIPKDPQLCELLDLTP